jgi:hypothetical protein
MSPPARDATSMNTQQQAFAASFEPEHNSEVRPAGRAADGDRQGARSGLRQSTPLAAAVFGPPASLSAYLAGWLL